MFQVAFICTGNTCRSPMAEALMKQRITQTGTRNLTVISAGMAAGGEPASVQAKKVMAKRGLDLGSHYSKPLTPQLLFETDLILTMTESHKRLILSYFPNQADKVFTLAEWCSEAADVVDPFGGDEACYESCAKQLEDYLAKSWEKLVWQAGKKANKENNGKNPIG